ncbi:hypothetical protein GQ600_12294 [Phytophthora cactorum]|nr:hypothetical protein GQ600_12294 [Phytophthora cactorum]
MEFRFGTSSCQALTWAFEPEGDSAEPCEEMVPDAPVRTGDAPLSSIPFCTVGRSPGKRLRRLVGTIATASGAKDEAESTENWSRAALDEGVDCTGVGDANTSSFSRESSAKTRSTAAILPSTDVVS